jgi:phage-related minor tail protein
MLAGAATLGLSMLATGVRNKDTEMIPIRAITSVTSKKGMANTTVSVITAGNTIDFKISHSEATKLKATLLQLMAG